MKRLSDVIAVTVISLLALVGCNSTQQSTTQVPSTTETTATPASDHSNVTQDGFGNLVTVVSNTKIAVKAGKFDQAKQEFDKFENAWAKVEDGVKTKSPKSYAAIEDTATQVKSALKAKDKAKALERLQTLDKDIATVSKS
ncbi:MAG: DUF4363 domain-containing protein [Iphinoe sp. HA4291-MV1]|jgi:soluble cytochrome b562|nr:DUF4363 domain-containing protein [Iphinoe sp. HA4291-MV1]